MRQIHITSNEQRVDSAMGYPSRSVCLLSFCFYPPGMDKRLSGLRLSKCRSKETIDNVLLTGGCLNGLFTDRQ